MPFVYHSKREREREREKRMSFIYHSKRERRECHPYIIVREREENAIHIS